jgi:hypothetical protein
MEGFPRVRSIYADSNGCFDADRAEKGYVLVNRARPGALGSKRRKQMPRTLIESHTGDKRFVRRKAGKFTSKQVNVGRSLAADRRSKSKHVVKKGEGDRGDQKRA